VEVPFLLRIFFAKHPKELGLESGGALLQVDRQRFRQHINRLLAQCGQPPIAS